MSFQGERAPRGFLEAVIDIMRDVSSPSDDQDIDMYAPETNEDGSKVAFFAKVPGAFRRPGGLNPGDGHKLVFSEVQEIDQNDDDYDSDSECAHEEPSNQPKGVKKPSPRNDQSALDVYIEVCHSLKIIPLTEVSRQFGKERICLRRSILGPKDVKALSNALLNDTQVRILDLSGIFMDLKMVQYMSLMLLENICIKELIIADNHLTGRGIQCVAEAIKENDSIRYLDISGNNLRDSDSVHVADIIQNGTSLHTLNLSHNELREEAGKIIGDALENNVNLKTLDLSWNHIRCRGAIDIAKSIQKNSTLTTLNLGWNGFAYGGALAIGEAMTKNTTLADLDLSCNRIHPPALLQLMKGITKNKTLVKLSLCHNPITAPFTSVLLASIRDSPHMALTYLDLDGIIVDEEFLKIQDVIESRRLFRVRYEAALPLNQFRRSLALKEFDKKDDVFTLDPIEMLYMLKEKMRAVDFFLKLDKEKTNNVTKAELGRLFRESGIPVTSASVDKAMEFIDFKRDGLIDLEEFLEADKKIKRHSRAKAAKRAMQKALSKERENRFSQSYRGAAFNETTGRVELDTDPEAKGMIEAALNVDSGNSVGENGEQRARNGLLKPLSARRRSSITNLYDRDRRSSVGGNLFFGWSPKEEEE